MDPDQPAHPRNLISIHAVRLPTLLQVEKLIANSMYPDQTARMHRLVWIYAGRKPLMLVLSWRGSKDLVLINRVLRRDLSDQQREVEWIHMLTSFSGPAEVW
jgi:hypothetical protein